MTSEKIDRTKVGNLKRDKPKEEPKKEEENKSVTQGAIEKITDYMFNPSKDKIREVTSIDRLQARWLPQLDVNNEVWAYLLKIAAYNSDYEAYCEEYKEEYPTPPNVYDIFTYRTAQWQKSVAAMNLKAGMELALAEKERELDDGSEPDWNRGINDD